MDYKELLFKFLEEDTNREYCVPIVEHLLNVRNIDKKTKEYKIKISGKSERIKQGDIKHLCEVIVKKSLLEGYTSMVIPTTIGVDQAPNFYISEEKPREEELWWWLYHLLTGIHYGDYVLNLANVPSEIREEFREYLIEQNFLIFESERSGLKIEEMLSQLNTPRGIPLKEFILGFIFVSYFAKFWKDWKEEEEIAKIVGKTIPEITDEASLLVFVLPKLEKKKEVYVLPKLKRILSHWYSDFSEDNIPYISNFIFSFYIADKDYREESVSLLNKFLYYFLQDYVNGELLTKLMELKIGYELRKTKRERIYGLKNAKQFFLKL